MPKQRIAINGFGRIGRNAFKIALTKRNIEIVAINDLTSPSILAHLLKYDTAYPEYEKDIKFDDKHLIVGRKKIPVFSEKDPKKLPWKKLGIDLVIESTGVFRDMKGAKKHITAGAKKVLISAPGKDPKIPSFVRGVNCSTYNGEPIIDNASCTTNCTAPVMAVLDKAFGVESAMLSTIHSYTADQRLQDAPHRDLRRARAAAQNIVPTSTGAAKATTKLIPNLEGVFDGIAFRTPTITGSLVDITLLLKKEASKEDINKVLSKAANGKLKGILGVTETPLVSSDYIGCAYSSVVDLPFTNVVGKLVKVVAWYDNEWGYANRLVEMAIKMR